MYIVSLKASALLESVFVESKQRWQNMFHHFLLSSMSSEACRATKEHLYTDAHGCFRCRSWASQAGIYTIGVTGEWGADDWNWWGALVAAGNDRIWNDRLKNTAWWWISGKRELRMSLLASYFKDSMKEAIAGEISDDRSYLSDAAAGNLRINEFSVTQVF